MRIIINTPKTTTPAGVANHYFGLRPFFSKNVVYNQYIPLGHLKQTKYKNFAYLISLLLKVFDVLKFIVLLIIYRRPKVLLNPSFGKTALKRDALFLYIAKLFNRKVAVFIHGWNNEYYEEVLTKKSSFSKNWFKADAFFVLASEFKQSLVHLGIKAPVYLTSTKVNDMLVEGINTKTLKNIKTILFLARVEKAKGVITTIDSFEILSKEYPFLTLQVVGSGSALYEAKEYAKRKNLDNIVFTGPLSGDALKNEFVKADLYILPTTHGEGMPTTVLEAMAFGLPVITRPVGGLVDFFENGKMGYMVESLDPKDYAEKIELLINNVGKVNEISKYNMQYAKEHFMASKVAPKLEQLINSI